jgi:hypothetical protein
MKRTLLLLVLFGSCSSRPQYLSNPAATPRPLQVNLPKSGWVPIFFEAINRRASIAGLSDLRTTALPNDDLEIRIWHGFGLTALHGFILRRSSATWSAVYLGGGFTDSTSEHTRELQPPKSGWEQFWQSLQTAGISSLPDADELQCNPGVNDGMSYVVELNSQGTYRTYMYENPSFAKCPSAQQMIRIGNTIAEEFGVKELGTEK